MKFPKLWKKTEDEAVVAEQITDVKTALDWARYACNSCNGERYGSAVVEVMQKVARDPGVIYFDSNLILNHFIPHCLRGMCDTARREIDDIIRYRRQRLEYRFRQI